MTLRHPRLAHALMHLRPGSHPFFSFCVQDEGEGPYLVEGSMQNPPTQAEVDAVTTEQLDAAQRSKSAQPFQHQPAALPADAVTAMTLMAQELSTLKAQMGALATEAAKRVGAE